MKTIKFTDDLFEQILKGKKTQTRRIVKKSHITNKGFWPGKTTMWLWNIFTNDFESNAIVCECPYGIKNDVVRAVNHSKTKSVFLKVSSLTVQQIQEISEPEAIAEGLENNSYGDYRNYKPVVDGEERENCTPIESFKTLWESIHGADSWDKNPWVWVIKFKMTI